MSCTELHVTIAVCATRTLALTNIMAKSNNAQQKYSQMIRMFSENNNVMLH